MAKRVRGGATQGRQPRQTGERRGRRESGADPGTRPSRRGSRIRYEEVAFEDGSQAHSRFIDGIVQANTLHPDYEQATRSSE